MDRDTRARVSPDETVPRINDIDGIEVVDDTEHEEEPWNVLPFKYAITSYGADYPVDGLVKRMSESDIFIPAFQRSFIWTFTQSSRFVESLLLGLPVPGVFFSREPDTHRLFVIDGQQRLRTLQYYYDGVFADGRVFALSGVQPEFRGVTYKKLEPEDRRRLDNSIIHATVFWQEQPSEDQSSIYHVFERLNTGGVQLTPQEIRACIFHGEFQELLAELNHNKTWRQIYGQPKRDRMRDQELILRFLALYFSSEKYTQPMKGFLNAFMGKNRELSTSTSADMKRVFEGALTAVYRAVGKRAFKPKRPLNAAVFESVMVGVARRLDQGAIIDHKGFLERYEALVQSDSYESVTETGTARAESVSKRIHLATEAFADVK